MSEPTGSAPAGGTPTAGGMPSAPTGDYAGGVVSPAVEESAETPDTGEETTETVASQPGAGAQDAAADEVPALPPTPYQTEIVRAAQHYYQAGQQIQQELPAVRAQKRAIEQQLQPYANNPALLEQLPIEAQYAVRQGYAQWQQLSGREQQLQQGWTQIEQYAPQLQQMFALAQREAVLNQVGEPMAYNLLARRAAQRSGDPNFPVEDMTEFLRGIPANLLESQATKFEQLHKKGRLAVRAAGMVDAMGPGGGTSSGGTRKRGMDAIRDAINDELRQRPPR
jgi:hypothetical protein